jgi:zinc transport system permease protein
VSLEPDTGLTLASFFESWELFADAVLAGTLAGALLGFLGVYVVLRRMVFFSAALSQTAGLGVTLAFYLQLHLGVQATLASPLVGALVTTLLAVGALTWRRRGGPAQRGQMDRDGALGVIFLLGGAGTLLVGTRVVQELQDVDSILFGTAVAVLPEDLTQLQVVAALVTALHLWWRRGFTAVTLDPEGARVRGLPTRALEWTLLLTLALAISVSTRILGALPTFAFSVLPALMAVRLGSNVHRSLWLAALLGAGLGFGGYILSYLYEQPVGASQTALGVGLFLITSVITGLAQQLRQRR